MRGRFCFYFIKILFYGGTVVIKEKIDKVDSIKEMFRNNCGLIFTNHSGLKVEGAVQIRDRLIKIDSYLKIVKNTLALIAAGEVFKEIDLSGILKGPTSLVVIGRDVAATAKILKEFSEEYGALRIKAAVLENKLLKPDIVEEIANLPSREILLTNLVVCIKSPISKLVNVLSSLTGNLVIVLNMIKQDKEKNSN